MGRTESADAATASEPDHAAGRSSTTGMRPWRWRTTSSTRRPGGPGFDAGPVGGGMISPQRAGILPRKDAMIGRDLVQKEREPATLRPAPGGGRRKACDPGPLGEPSPRNRTLGISCDVVANHKSGSSFTYARSYLQGLGIDSKAARIDSAGAVNYYNNPTSIAVARGLGLEEAVGENLEAYSSSHKLGNILAEASYGRL